MLLPSSVTCSFYIQQHWPAALVGHHLMVIVSNALVKAEVCTRTILAVTRLSE